MSKVGTPGSSAGVAEQDFEELFGSGTTEQDFSGLFAESDESSFFDSLFDDDDEAPGFSAGVAEQYEAPGPDAGKADTTPGSNEVEQDSAEQNQAPGPGTSNAEQDFGGLFETAPKDYWLKHWAWDTRPDPIYTPFVKGSGTVFLTHKELKALKSSGFIGRVKGMAKPLEKESHEIIGYLDSRALDVAKVGSVLWGYKNITLGQLKALTYVPHIGRLLKYLFAHTMISIAPNPLGEAVSTAKDLTVIRARTPRRWMRRTKNIPATAFWRAYPLGRTGGVSTGVRHDIATTEFLLRGTSLFDAVIPEGICTMDMLLGTGAGARSDGTGVFSVTADGGFIADGRLVMVETTLTDNPERTHQKINRYLRLMNRAGLFDTPRFCLFLYGPNLAEAGASQHIARDGLYRQFKEIRKEWGEHPALDRVGMASWTDYFTEGYKATPDLENLNVKCVSGKEGSIKELCPPVENAGPLCARLKGLYMQPAQSRDETKDFGLTAACATRQGFRDIGVEFSNNLGLSPTIYSAPWG